MKSLSEYFLEAKKIYEFRIKMAGVVESNCIDKLETRLDKYGLISFSNVTTTPIQESPLGFSPTVQNCEVNIVDIETEYPVTPPEIQNIVKNCTNLPDSHVVVIHKNHPCELENDTTEKSDKALLDTDYPKTSGKVPYGDKFIASLLKQHKSKKMPTAAGGKSEKSDTTNSLPQGIHSPIGSSRK